MKYLLTSILLLAFLTSNAQQQRQTTGDTILHEAGSELYKYHRRTSTGVLLGLSGSLLFVIGTEQKTTGRLSGFQIIGAGLGAIGFVMSLTSSVHVGNAGILLMNLSGNTREGKLSRRQVRRHAKSRF